VYIRDGVSLVLPEIDAPPSPGILWALSRAGRAAAAAGLLTGGSFGGKEAVRLGLAQGVVATEDRLPLPSRISIAALTAARDLMRSRAGGAPGRALELATFRLLFARGDPIEGALAFLERRDPEF
jgi:enoyl-CoA hydratase/carnithine racemase